MVAGIATKKRKKQKKKKKKKERKKEKTVITCHLVSNTVLTVFVNVTIFNSWRWVITLIL